MQTSTKVMLGIAGIAALGTGIVLWPKKASASEMPGGGGGKTPPKEEPKKEEKLPDVKVPSWWSAAPSWWTAPAPKMPTDYKPPVDWIPPWLTAETKSKEPGTISDEYKAGFNDGFTDAAYGSDFGTRQNKVKYASSPSYKNGYDQGWKEYTSKVETAGVTGVGQAYMHKSRGGWSPYMPSRGRGHTPGPTHDYIRRGAKIIPSSIFKHRY